MADPSIERLRRVVAVAYNHLQERRQEINDLNVFPVPDGDTGDNMTGTMRAVLEGLESLRANPLATVDRNYIVDTVAHSALMGARGNSGVILSQIVRGAAEVLSTRRGELIGPLLVRDALERAATAARDSMSDPREGTMLTAIRVIYEAVAAKVEEIEQRHLAPGTADATQDAVLAELLVAAIAAGNEAVEKSQEQLDVLREAGVVDAGAYGLVVIVAGLVAGLAGQDAAPSSVPHQSAAGLKAGFHTASRYRYCTSCIVTGRSLDPKTIAPRLERLGDSIAVVGDETMLKVHVHTDTPGEARSICEEHGDVHQFEFTDMRRQIADQRERRAGAAAARTGVVAIASGDGIAKLFAAEGALVVDGGPTLNPSIQEILEGIQASAAGELIVLPNSANVVLAAEEAAKLADRPVRVVATHSQQAGLRALVAFDSTASADENAASLEGELETIETGLVAAADRDDPDGRYTRGQAVGFVGEDLVAWGQPEATLAAVVEQMAGEAEIITVLEGEATPVHARELELATDGAEIEILEGGQPTWWWLIVAE